MGPGEGGERGLSLPPLSTSFGGWDIAAKLRSPDLKSNSDPYPQPPYVYVATAGGELCLLWENAEFLAASSVSQGNQKFKLKTLEGNMRKRENEREKRSERKKIFIRSGYAVTMPREEKRRGLI